MPRSLLQLLTLASLAALSACAPPDLTAPQEELVRRCLELAYKHEAAPPDCAQGVAKPMQKAFLKKHPNFYDQLLADRVAFVEARIAEDQRRQDELNQCLDHREAGNMDSPVCGNFMAHEITRGLEYRRLRRCAEARLDGRADEQLQCDGLSDRQIEDELQAERVRRAGR